MTNSERVARARRSLDEYFREDRYAGLDQHISDALANLMHLCKFEGFKFNEALRVARDHYKAEKDGFED